MGINKKRKVLSIYFADDDDTYDKLMNIGNKFYRAEFIRNVLRNAVNRINPDEKIGIAGKDFYPELKPSEPNVVDNPSSSSLSNNDEDDFYKTF